MNLQKLAWETWLLSPTEDRQPDEKGRDLHRLFSTFPISVLCWEQLPGKD